MDYLIRPAEQKDADPIYRIICELQECNLTRFVFEKIFKENIENPHFIYFVAEAGNNFIGFISCHTQCLLHRGGRVAEIQELFIHPLYRGFRIGQKLIEDLEKKALFMNCISLEATAELNQKHTLLFYEKNAFIFTQKKCVKQLG
ncbi:MAG: GNAT family N-acetyltransferase [Chitinophagaceae bacterium]